MGTQAKPPMTQDEIDQMAKGILQQLEANLDKFTAQYSADAVKQLIRLDNLPGLTLKGSTANAWIAAEAQKLLARYESLTPARLVALMSCLASVGLTLLLADQGLSDQERTALFNHAMKVFGADFEVIETLASDIETLASDLRAELQVKPKRKRSQARPLTQNGSFLLSSSDRITRAITEALLPNALKRGEALETINRGLENQGIASSRRFWAAYPVESSAKKAGTLRGAVGFRGQPSEAIWNSLQKNNALAVKLQFALMARAYAETNFEPGQFVTVDINQICDDMGYVRKKGSHRRENKEAVKELLEVVTSTEIALIFQAPGRDGRTKFHKLEGPYWTRGVMHSESDRYGDLFQWTPETFTYSSGHFFASEDWRAYNSAVAFVGEGLLRLSAKDQDKHALLLGAYIALFARIQNYKRKAFRVSTLIQRVFNPTEAIAHRNTARLINTLEKSLDRLKEVEVIGSWRYDDEQDLDSSEVDYDDLESVETRVAMATEASRRRNSAAELNRTIIIEWPQKLIEHALKCRQNKQLHQET